MVHEPSEILYDSLDKIINILNDINFDPNTPIDRKGKMLHLYRQIDGVYYDFRNRIIRTREFDRHYKYNEKLNKNTPHNILPFVFREFNKIIDCSVYGELTSNSLASCINESSILRILNSRESSFTRTGKYGLFFSMIFNDSAVYIIPLEILIGILNLAYNSSSLNISWPRYRNGKLVSEFSLKISEKISGTGYTISSIKGISFDTKYVSKLYIRSTSNITNMLFGLKKIKYKGSIYYPEVIDRYVTIQFLNLIENTNSLIYNIILFPRIMLVNSINQLFIGYLVHRKLLNKFKRSKKIENDSLPYTKMLLLSEAISILLEREGKTSWYSTLNYPAYRTLRSVFGLYNSQIK